jgi:hypothetical protein
MLAGCERPQDSLMHLAGDATRCTRKAIGELRQRCVVANELPDEERGVLLALLGSDERVLYLAKRIQSERRTVSHELPQLDAVPNRGLILGSLSPEEA